MPSEYEKFREEYILPSELTPKEVEIESYKLVEAEYIKSFVLGLSLYYTDDSKKIVHAVW